MKISHLALNTTIAKQSSELKEMHDNCIVEVTCEEDTHPPTPPSHVWITLENSIKDRLVMIERNIDNKTISDKLEDTSSKIMEEKITKVGGKHTPLIR